VQVPFWSGALRLRGRRAACLHAQWSGMPNLSALLKAEITRLARKEVRAGTARLHKAAAAYRSEIAALKRRMQALEQQLRRARRGADGPVGQNDDAADAAQDGKVRFSPKWLASQRRRLGLSAADCGLLFGTTGQAIYNWESGRARPRARHLAAVAALRKLGKRQAAEIVAARRSA
jgi:DNA-binding transcriptional regulator YiaG